jgi:hypothetical protein
MCEALRDGFDVSYSKSYIEHHIVSRAIALRILTYCCSGFRSGYLVAAESPCKRLSIPDGWLSDRAIEAQGAAANKPYCIPSGQLPIYHNTAQFKYKFSTEASESEAKLRDNITMLHHHLGGLEKGSTE